jgi:hypothetical protein
MAQRTVFPAIPNTAEAAYSAVLASLFAELDRAGGSIPFKVFRTWLKERNIYNKEEVDALMAYLGCQTKPEAVIGDFGRKYLACDTSDKQQTALYMWTHAWNRFLTKYVFEALDVDGGGRLHSTHELYRLITSYVYAGEYVTLPNFQSWIKWMAGAGYIRYIGIRWGLSDKGKAEMAKIRMMDVDELLEDEEEEAAAAEAAGVAEDAEVPTPVLPPVAGVPATEAAEPAGADEEEMPDMPPEAPVPQWEPPEEAEAAAAPTPEAKAPPKTQATPTRKRAASAKAEAGAVAPPVGWFDAKALGFDPRVYSAHPGVFLLELAIAARLATASGSDDWRPFFADLKKEQLIHKWFVEGRKLEEVLADAGWFAAWGPRLGLVVIDLLRIGSILKASPDFATTLEESADVGGVVWRLHDRIFAGEISAAPFWMVRAMYAMELWDNPTP